MLIFWIILFWVTSLFMVNEYISGKREVVDSIRYKKINLILAMVSMSVIVFFAGLRSGVSDTTAYINWFNLMPNKLQELGPYLTSQDKDLGFIFLSCIFKIFISENYQIWIFTIALCSCIGIFIGIKRYSINFHFSMFLFVTTCYFSWLFNGIRQFLVAAILFGCNKLIIDRKFCEYLCIVLVCATIHSTALIMIPIYFIVNIKPWCKKIILLVGLFLLAIILNQYFSGILNHILRDTVYSKVVDQFAQDDGVHILRVVVAAIPLMLALYKKKKIDRISPKYVDISINMSLIAVLFYALGTVTSGIYIGRLPIYFELYNLLLLPWILKSIFNKNEKPLIYYLCGLGYLAFFYYQMVIAWEGFGYISELLGINMRWMTNYFY